MRTLFSILVSCSLFAVSLYSQVVSTAQISGTVQDSSGASVPGAEVRVTQTETGLERNVVTSDNGAYTITNLPVGPYKLQVSKAGFNTFIQEGIVLQVSSNPEINVALKVGSLTEQVVVEAAAAMVETHETGVGQVIDQARVTELPLNGRQATDLIFLAGAAASAPAGDLNSNKNYPTQTISVAGGLPNGITYVMDGASNNDVFNNLNLPFPFPDALQEFKLETSAVPAQYGQHASAAVNVVTKSGSNQIHGDAFDFLRNSIFNARDFFATKRDSLKRNQFGGTVGGPIQKDKLFFFAGYQGTYTKSDPPNSISYVPTAAMLAGDFSGCSSVGTLKAPFVGNKVSASLLNPSALKLATYLPQSSDPCGKVVYGIVNDSREHQILGRADYQMSEKNRLFARYFIANFNNPVLPSKNALEVGSKVGQADQTQSVVLSDTYLISANIVNTAHLTVNRSRAFRVVEPYFTPADLGSQVYSPIPGFAGISVSGNGFSLGAGAVNPGYFNSLAYEAGDDINWIKGSHQIAFGGNWIHGIMNSDNNRPTNGQFTFSGQTTGAPMADLLIGSVSGGFVQGNSVYDNDRANFFGVYTQDTWKVSKRLTLNLGVRWEPFLPEHNVNKYVSHFDLNQFIAGTKSSVYANAPAGLSFPGDPGFPGHSNTSSRFLQFEPRIGLIWDPKGDGRTTIRSSYGIFYDTPQLFFYTRFANNPPWGAQISLSNPAGGFSNPYLGYPGGNPFPGLSTISTNSIFPLAGVYVNMPLNVHAPYLQQWNLSVQKQLGSDWLISATYLGNKTTHFWAGTELDPAVYAAGATTGNTNNRRVLYLLNPAQGKYYSTIGQLDDGGTESYNGLLLSAQKRLSHNLSALANYTWAHCVSDPETTELTGPTYINPANREQDRANCSSDRRRIFNLSLVASTPKFSNKSLNWFAGGWQFTGIVRLQTGNFSTVTTGVDNALTGIGSQRPNQVLSSIYGVNTITNYLNRAAFASPAAGTLGNEAPFTVVNPSMVQIDIGLSRTFAIRESQSVQFRWDVFNAPNHLNPAAPVTALNAGAFGQIQADINGSSSQSGDPRIMQFALKYKF